jgi:protein disulfide-isomerase A6
VLLLGLTNVALAFYTPSDDVVTLTATNFDSLVKRSDSTWVVEFFAPWCGHCKSLTPEYKKAATAAKGHLKLGAINCDDHAQLCQQFGVKGYPTIKIFGSNKNTPVDHQGARDAKGILESALAEAKKTIKAKLSGGGNGGGSSSGGSSDVVELTDANFDREVLKSDQPVLVEFFAPWCGHCKNLEPEYKKAAAELKGKVKLCMLDATVNTIKAQQYGVQGYPTIKFFGAGPKDSESVTDYDGGRTAADIVNWALEKYADSIPAPELIQLTTEDVATKACAEKPLCVVAFLPHILVSEIYFSKKFVF